MEEGRLLLSALVPDGKDWVDVVAALATPIIAALALMFAYRGYRLERRRRVDELFDRRYAFYKKAENWWLNTYDDEPPNDAIDVYDAISMGQEARFLFGEEVAQHIINLAGKSQKGGPFWPDSDFSKPFFKYLDARKMTPAAPLPRWVDLGLIPLLNLATAFLVAGLVVVLIGEDPLEATRIILYGALGRGEGVGFTLYYATNFTLTGLAVSVELDEVRGLADRVLVMFDGSIVGECAPETPEAEIGLLMAGARGGRRGDAPPPCVGGIWKGGSTSG